MQIPVDGQRARIIIVRGTPYADLPCGPKNDKRENNNCGHGDVQWILREGRSKSGLVACGAGLFRMLKPGLY